MASGSLGGEPSPPRVLFIDDDATGRQIAAHNLRQAGFQVDLAADGAEGLRLFGRQDYDVVAGAAGRR